MITKDATDVIGHAVEHVVKITSNASADSPIARRRWQADIEAGLTASGLGHTLLRSHAYMWTRTPAIPASGAWSPTASRCGRR